MHQAHWRRHVSTADIDATLAVTGQHAPDPTLLWLYAKNRRTDLAARRSEVDATARLVRAEWLRPGMLDDPAVVAAFTRGAIDALMLGGPLDDYR